MNPGDCEHVQEWNGCLDGGESSEKCNESLAGEVRAKGWFKGCQPTVDARLLRGSPPTRELALRDRGGYDAPEKGRSQAEAGLSCERTLSAERGSEGSVSPEGSRRRARTFSCHLRPHSCSQALLISAQHEQIGILLIGRW